IPKGLSTLLIGDATVGQQLVDSPIIPLVSATGSTAMGRVVRPRLAKRFARAILELGGNNAAIVAPTADLDLTLRGVAFAAMGTAGQRCTTLRRLDGRPADRRGGLSVDAKCTASRESRWQQGPWRRTRGRGRRRILRTPGP